MALIAISLIGPQGSGKSTQIQALEEKGFKTVTMSKVIVEAMQKDRKFAALSARYMSRGMLVPTKFVMPVLWPYLDALSAEAEKNGHDLKIVFDGVPRNRKQAMMLEERYFKPNKFQRMYIFLDLSFEEALDRINGRVKKMKERGETPRADDCDEQAVKERLTTYFKHHGKIRRYFQKIDARVVEVNGRLSAEKITEQITGCVSAEACAA